MKIHGVEGIEMIEENGEAARLDRSAAYVLELQVRQERLLLIHEQLVLDLQMLGHVIEHILDVCNGNTRHDSLRRYCRLVS